MNEPNVIELFQGQDKAQAQLLLDRQIVSAELLRAAYFFPRKSRKTDLIGVLLDRGEIEPEIGRQIRKQLFREDRGIEMKNAVEFRHDGRDNATNPTIMWGPSSETQTNQRGVLAQLRTNQTATVTVGTSGGTQTRFGDLFDRDKYAQEQDLATRSRLKMVDDYNHIRAASPTFAPHADLVFEHRKQLGVGGMGVVHQVVDTRLGREAALKVMRSDKGNRRDIRRFIREAQITARLDHPAIPPVFEAGTNASGQYFMLMQVINGVPFSDILKAYHRNRARKRRDLEDLLQVLVRVGEALSYAHNQGIVHRDIKPSNIMVGRFGEVMVMDWGIATDLSERQRVREINDEDDVQLTEDEVGAELTQMGAIMGTVGYMPPEQARGDIIDERADIFALGAMLSKILTNQTPFDGRGTLERLRNSQQGRVRYPLDRHSHVPKELNAIAAAALHPKVEFRTRTVADFTSDIKAFLAGYSVSTYQYNSWERLLRAIRANPLLPISVVVVTIIVLGSIQLYTVTQNSREQARLLKEANRQKKIATEEAENARKASEEARAQAKKASDAAAEARLQTKVANASERRANKAAADARKAKRRAEENSKRASEAKRVALTALKAADQNLANLYVEKADRTLTENDSLKAEAFLAKSVSLDANSFRIQRAYLNARLRGTALRWSSPFRTRLYCLSYRPKTKSSPPLLAGAGEEGTVTIWNPISGKQLFQLSGFDGQILQLRFRPKSNQIAACGKGGNIVIWDLDKNEVSTSLSRGNELFNASIAFDDSGKNLLVSGIEQVRQDQTLVKRTFLRVWNIQSQNLARRFYLDTTNPPQLYEIPALKSIAALIDGNVQFYRTALGVLQAPTTEMPESILDLATLKDQLHLITTDKTLHSFTVANQTLKPVKQAKIKVEHDLTAIQLSETGARLACFGSDSNTVSILDSKNLATISQYQQHRNGIAAVAMVSSQVYTASDLDLHRWRQDNAKRTCQMVGHAQTPRTVALSERLNLIVSAGDSGQLLVWSSKTGQLLQTLSAHDGQITTLVISPDGTKLASASADRTVLVWDLKTLKSLAKLEGAAQGITCLSFHPSGQFLAAGLADPRAEADKVYIWDLKTQKLHLSANTNKGAIEAIDFDHSGRLLAIAGVEQYSPPPKREALNRSVKLWSFEQNAEIATLNGHSNEVTGLAFSPDNRYLVSADSAGKLIVWDPDNGVSVAQKQLNSAIKALQFTPTGRGRDAAQNRQQVYYLATAGTDQLIHIWNVSKIRNITELVQFSGHRAQISDLAVSSDGRLIASVSKDKRIKLWELNQLELNAHKAPLTTLDFSSDGKVIASGSVDRQVRFWNTETGAEIWTLKGRARKVEDLVFLDQSNTETKSDTTSSAVAIADGTGSIEIWDYRKQQLLSRLEGHSDAVTMLLFDPGTSRLFSASRDKTIRIWTLKPDWKDHTHVTLSGHTAVVSAIAISADGQKLYSGSWDRSVRIWDVNTAKQISSVKGISEPINSVAVTSLNNSVILATASQNQIVRLYNLTAKSEARLLRGHSKGVTQIQFVPDGRALITASLDGTLKIWRSDDGRLLLNLDNQGIAVSCLTTKLANSKLQLASGSTDAKIRFWNVETINDNFQTMLEGTEDEQKAQRQQYLKRSEARTGFRVQDLGLTNLPQNHLVD